MLHINNLSFSYDTQPILETLNFVVQQGTYTAIIGESGCGKSTLLELIYGLLQPSEGSIHWKGIQLLGPEHYLVPGASFMKYLSQDFDLMPYTTVAENIGKFLSNFFPEEKQKRIQKLLEVIEMIPFAHSKVKNLSGGQKQRVALARALAKEPELLLLDEPFSHIDNFKKNSLRRKLFQYLKEKQITSIVATHDTTDILSYTDTTIVLRNQRIIANAPTMQLYQNPKQHYVAALFGEVNVLPLSFFTGKQPDSNQILLYPHDLYSVAKSHGKVTIIASYPKGHYYLIEANKEGQLVFFAHQTPLEPKTIVFLTADKQLLENRILHTS